jgi:hypothetical protein
LKNGEPFMEIKKGSLEVNRVIVSGVEMSF